MYNITAWRAGEPGTYSVGIPGELGHCFVIEEDVARALVSRLNQLLGNAAQTPKIVELERRIAELEKRNPTEQGR